MSELIINGLVTGLVVVVVAQGLFTYAIARLFITGRGMFERKQEEPTKHWSDRRLS